MFLLPDQELERAERVLRQRVDPHVDRIVERCCVAGAEYAGEPVDSRIMMERIRAGCVEFVDCAAPFRWGRVWGTTWFRLTGRIPEVLRTGDAGSIRGPLELQIDLGWLPERGPGFQAEGMVYREDGTAVKSVNPRNHWVPLMSADGVPNVPLGPDGTFTVYVEAAANPFVEGATPFSATELGERPEIVVRLQRESSSPKDPVRSMATRVPDGDLYTFKRADVCVHDVELAAYRQELGMVVQVIRELRSEQPRYWQLLKALQRSLNAYDERDATTIPDARAELAAVLAEPAESSVIRHVGVGHAHIDSAWLWPVRETRRKVARTVSNVLALMDQDPDFTYAMSSAQQYAWLEQDHPDLFAKVLRRIREGRFIPVGGMWVESDNMIPCGESLVRQITYGRRYFRERLGVEPQGVWLPDSFGYTGAWPQIARRAGYHWFLTQKISWNDTTRFPHHSFLWEGIDGTPILTHFPPSDTYCSAMDVRDLTYSQANYLDKDISRNAIILYGWGDGGGGPTREMTADLRLMHNLDGVPRVEFGTPDELFRRIGDDLRNAGDGETPTFHGELYLERHRGTLTSQQDMKLGCRREESMLRVTEYLCALAAYADAAYEVPYDELDGIWHTLLLNQFHDILPGSAIAWVHRQAREEYARDIARLRDIAETASGAIARALGSPLIEEGHLRPFSADPELSWRAVPGLTGAQTPRKSDGSAEGDAVCVVTESPDAYVLDNGLLAVTVARDGTVISIIDLGCGRQLIPAGTRLGQYEMLRNEPFHWDAWEIQRDALMSARAIEHSEVIGAQTDPDGIARVHIRSWQDGVRIETVIALAPGSMRLDFDAAVDWHAAERFLKVDVPMTPAPAMAQYECQYGLVERPIAKNTRADEAKFESCTQRFVRVADSSYAMAVVNASTYGSDTMPIRRGTLVGTMIRLSLLSSPLYPDPRTDQGRHRFRWAVVADASMERTLDAAACLNEPDTMSLPDCDPLIRLESVAGCVVLDWVKLADDRSGDLVIRAYEAAGGEGIARLRVANLLCSASSDGCPMVRETDLLEQELSSADGLPHVLREETVADGAELHFAPFEMATLRIHVRRCRA